MNKILFLSLLFAMRIHAQSPLTNNPVLANSFFDDVKSVSNNIRAANDIVNLIDNNTGELASFVKVSTYKDGSAMNASKVDGAIYRKKGNDYYKRAFYGPVNVRWFGAKGDARTDDTEAIQKAINLYDNIYIPQGEYHVSGIVISKKGLTIHGDSKEASILYAIKKQEFVLAVRHPGSRSAIIEDVAITDLKIDGAYRSKYGLVTNIISSVIERINATSCLEYGIYHFMGYTSTYRDCSARHCGVAGLNVFQEGNLLIFERCVFSNNNGSGILHSSGSTNMFLSCSIENNKNYGVLLTYQSDPTIKYPPFNPTHTELINFTSCFFENNGSSNRQAYSDIRISGQPDPGVSKVRSVIIKGCHFGISSNERVLDLAGDMKNIVIEDNFFGNIGPRTGPPILIGSFFVVNSKRTGAAISFRNNNLNVTDIEIANPPSPEFSRNAIADLLGLTQQATLNIKGLTLSLYKIGKLVTVYMNGSSSDNIDQNINVEKTGIIVNTAEKLVLFEGSKHNFTFETKSPQDGNAFYLRMPVGKTFNNLIVTYPTQY